MNTRDTMLNIARTAILNRAAMDGYAEEDYDPSEDSEGYVISLLIALRHWTDKYGIDWQAELARAHELFAEDKREDEDIEGGPNDERPACVPSAAREAEDKIFEIVCGSDWPEKPDAWPEEEILQALKEMCQEHVEDTIGV